MSKPRYYWYGIVKKMIMRYPQMKNDAADMELQYIKAIEETLEETKELDQAELRLKAIELILFKKTMTTEGVAQKIFYERRTIDRWLSKFINDVGRKVGY